ncbi:MAG TPA: MarR family transcriptional regulator [Dehalococcoidia bacterium]|nr:MarR family transcriptional regulator [Dehalococcoidia bacterium]
MDRYEERGAPGEEVNRAAGLLLDLVPRVMREFRASLGRHLQSVSLPQFRALAFLMERPGASLSELAHSLGLTLPSASALVDALVARGLVWREVSPQDRRCLTLGPTEAGRQLYANARQAAQTRIAALLSRLDPERQRAVLEGLQALADAFLTIGPSGREGGHGRH